MPLLTPEEHERYAGELERLREIRDHDLRGLLREARTFVANDAAEEIIHVAPQIVTLGRSVEYLGTGKVATYRIAGVPPSSGSGAVSAGSPIGAALMGRSAGDIVAVELPRGRVESLRVVSVVREERAA